MSNQIKADFFNSQGKILYDNFEIDEYPDTCPICHQGIEPAYRCAWNENQVIVAILKCPKRKCKSLFVSVFMRERDEAPGPIIPIYKLKGSFPKNPREHVFPDEIRAISKEFCEIYNESEAAEQRGLKNICGAGYRKALEFLIKDYLINDKKADAETIRKTYLSTCIKKHIDEGNIRACAERAAWLGNDETHYYRLWEEKDLKDLKNLIDLTVAWIHLEHVTRKTIEEMPDKKRGE
jgi:hypothetical protein